MPGTRSPKRPLLIALAVVVAVLAVVVIWHGRSTVDDRGERKAEATQRCQDAVRDDIRERLTASGDGAAQEQTADAGFSDISTRTTSVGPDDEAALRNAGLTRASVATEWTVQGAVSIPGELPGPARLGPTNTFVCNAVVLTDDSVMVTYRKLN
ncbi:hypothetical protein D7316_03813 [Gordonia insulae]|uniref:Uncharacterized protein n=2 Tax=Gordonia insulae TaxID=2420509 RepID=A0A3G8JR60_9ACTN|nr:hypothetical protein D7316_03813 [Gordonia insulae]